MTNLTKIKKVCLQIILSLIIIGFLFPENCIQHASFMRVCSSNGRSINSRLKISNVASEFCSIGISYGLVNCAMFTIVVSLCRSFAY